MRIKVTTTISSELHEMMTDKGIRPTDALSRGIIVMCKETLPPPPDHIIEKETTVYKAQKFKQSLGVVSDALQESNQEIDRLQNVIRKLEEKKGREERK